MITTCTGCQTRYRLDSEKVPHRLVRVRCPRCRAVFLLDGTKADQEERGGLVLERAGDGLQAARRQGQSPAVAEGIRSVGAPAATVEQPRSEPAAPLVEEPAIDERTQSLEPIADTVPPATESERPLSAAPEAPVEESGHRRGRSRDKTRLLARALVSDIVVYNREARDKALSEGNLLEALGPEIKKSWELYKEKVTADVANSTTHFRDALNEILAEGQKIF
jgi:predicted Zn finger-like uncharacterized protein